MIRIAVIGPGNISRRFMEGMRDVQDAEVTAFVTRSPEKVKDYADKYQVKQLLSFEEFLSQKSADAVYISTPNAVHAQEIQSCLSAGIHVLCEKPAVLTAAEYEQLKTLAHEKQLVFMEAQKALYTPVYQKIKEWLQEEKIGRVLSARAGFCRNEHHPEDAWRLKGIGAGALYDVGCYPLSVLVGLFQPQSPEIIHEIHEQENGVILDGTIILKEEARSLTAEYSMIHDRLCALEIIGEQGTITCPEFWKGHACFLRVKENEDYEADFRSEFTFETETFVRRILQGIVHDPESEQISAGVLEIIER